MLPNQVWKSRETKSYILKIVGLNPDGTVQVTFDFGYSPKKVFKYTADYLNQFYEYAGYESKWLNEHVMTSPVPAATPAPINTPTEAAALEKAFAELDPEKVLFGDYTKAEKVNVWKAIK